MTWTYSGNPSASQRDAVRFLIGDTDTADQQLTDEEIAYLLTEHPQTYVAAATAAEALAAKYARMVDKSVGDLSIEYGQRRRHYYDLAQTLRTRATTSSGGMWAGGISRDDKQTEREDTDRVQPLFYRGMNQPDRDRDRTGDDSLWQDLVDP